MVDGFAFTGVLRCSRAGFLAVTRWVSSRSLKDAFITGVLFLCEISVPWGDHGLSTFGEVPGDL